MRNELSYNSITYQWSLYIIALDEACEQEVSPQNANKVTRKMGLFPEPICFPEPYGISGGLRGLHGVSHASRLRCVEHRRSSTGAAPEHDDIGAESVRVLVRRRRVWPT